MQVPTQRSAGVTGGSGAGSLLRQLLALTNLGAAPTVLNEALSAAQLRVIQETFAAIQGDGSGGGQAGGARNGGGKGGGGDGSGASEASPLEAASVADVREMFPDLGHGFALAGLRHFNGAADRLIDALLEDRLPPPLAALARDLTELPPSAAISSPEPPASSGLVSGNGGGSRGGRSGSGRGGRLRGARDETLALLDQHGAVGRKPTRAALEENAMSGGGGSGTGGSGALAWQQQLTLEDDGAAGDERWGSVARQRSGAAYEDEWDDSLEAVASVSLSESVDDLESRVAAGTRAAGVAAAAPSSANHAAAPASAAQSGGPKRAVLGEARPAGSGAGAALPSNALEWVRAIGLAQYADKLQVRALRDPTPSPTHLALVPGGPPCSARNGSATGTLVRGGPQSGSRAQPIALQARGIVRLELAARLEENDWARLGATPAHMTRLALASRSLHERLLKAGRKVPTNAQPSYAPAAMVHYDDETGEFYDEDIGRQPPKAATLGDAPPHGGGGGGGAGSSAPPARAPPTAAQEARRREQRKRNEGKYRKNQAARKETRALG